MAANAAAHFMAVIIGRLTVARPPLVANVVGEQHASMRIAWRVGLLAVAVLVGSSCHIDPRPAAKVDPNVLAVWSLRPNQHPKSTDQILRLAVTQTACNDGRNNPVRGVDVSTNHRAVTITVTTRPVTGGAHTCPLGPAMKYDLTLDEPLGHRKLIDGQCRHGTGLMSTAWCDPDGVRFDPDAPVSKKPVSVAGTLIRVGGPAGTPRTLLNGGTVRFEGPVTRTARVSSAGSWSIDLPPGRYVVTGQHPDINGGAWDCSGPPVDVSDSAELLGEVDVVCSIK